MFIIGNKIIVRHLQVFKLFQQIQKKQTNKNLIYISLSNKIKNKIITKESIPSHSIIIQHLNMDTLHTT